MKYRFVLAVFLVLFLGIMAACGNSTTPSGSQAGQAPTPAGSSPSAQTSATGMQTVYVTLSDDRITSSMMSFAWGASYHFVVTNQGHSPNTFAMISRDHEQEMEHMTPGERHHAAMYMGDSIMPGQAKAFDYTFDHSMMDMGEHPEFACYQQGQNQAYMHLPFTITQN